jgi:sugar lactone lactonase YvrE
VALASGLVWPFGIAVDGTDVYFTSYDGQGSLNRVPKVGGQTTVLGAPLDYPDQIVLDDAYVYYTLGGTGAIVKLAKDDTSSMTLFSGQGGPSGIAADDEALYWVDYFSGAVMSGPKSGGAATTLASGEPSPYRIAAGPTRVYWSSFAPELRSVGKTGGSVATTPSGGQPRTIATDATHVYWTDWQASTLMSAALDGSGNELLASFPTSPDGLAVDDANVYVALTGGEIVAVPREGGAYQTIATGQDTPAIVAIDGACVYWTNQAQGVSGAGSVMRAPK